MSKYKVAIWEEVSGFIDVEAKSKEEAEEKAEELMYEHGVETLFYPPKESQFTHDEDLTKYNGKHTHRNAEVLTCEEVSE
ncbi:MAG: hypothetical protein CME70_05680 [Halobacteriovorax sp.]|nr:hypothetical protein [Halobacteriovorax sp.]|tara:strand:+ start:294 stop:533 length:240 start_codon:yes stop_codon:yes gene_type:complete